MYHVDPNSAYPNDVLGQADDHDIAIVVFSGMPDLPPYGLAPAGSNTLGAGYTVVGYGRTDPNSFTVGRRYYGAFQSSYQDSWYFGSQAPICEGDSGGPALLKIRNTDYIAGINDFGGPACSTGYEYRVDTAQAQAFVNGGFLATS